MFGVDKKEAKPAGTMCSLFLLGRTLALQKSRWDFKQYTLPAFRRDNDGCCRTISLSKRDSHEVVAYPQDIAVCFINTHFFFFLAV